MTLKIELRDAATKDSIMWGRKIIDRLIGF